MKYVSGIQMVFFQILSCRRCASFGFDAINILTFLLPVWGAASALIVRGFGTDYQPCDLNSSFANPAFPGRLPSCILVLELPMISAGIPAELKKAETISCGQKPKTKSCQNKEADQQSRLNAVPCKNLAYV